MDFDLKERVRAASDIVDVIGAQYELRRSGRNFVIRCPWHDDRKPSLTINPVRQSWKCWPCDIGGDVFSFVMRRDGVDFPTAMRFLAERAGIDIPPRGGRRVEPGSPEDRKHLLRAVQFAADACYELLDAGKGADVQRARQYMADRGINEEMRKTFRIGFAPDQWEWMKDKAAAAEFTPAVQVAAGFAIENEERKRIYDRFRGRLMFPICDGQGRPISLGGRIIPRENAEDQGAKYINGPETLLYRKSDQLYGLHLAMDAIRRGGTAMVMEGYTDVVAAAQSGISNAVAVLGTALTSQHIRVLKRFAERIVLVLDGDAAGQKRADEVLDLFASESIDLRIMTLPDAMDPADYLAANGRDAFLKMAGDAPDALEHQLARLTDGVDLATETHVAASAIEKLLGTLSKSPQDVSDLRLQAILQRLSRVFSMPVDSLQNRLVQLQKQFQEQQRLQQQRQRERERQQRQQRAGGPPTSSDEPGGVITDDEAARLLGANFDSLGNSDVGPAIGGDAFGGQTLTIDAPWRSITGMDRDLFEIMFESPELVSVALDHVDPSCLATDTARSLLALYQQLDLEGRDLDIDTLLLHVEDDRLKNEIINLDDRLQNRIRHADDPQYKPTDQVAQGTQERFDAVLDRYRQVQWSQETTRNIEQLNSGVLPEDDELAMLQELIQGERNRQGLDPDAKLDENQKGS